MMSAFSSGKGGVVVCGVAFVGSNPIGGKTNVDTTRLSLLLEQVPEKRTSTALQNAPGSTSAFFNE